MARLLVVLFVCALASALVSGCSDDPSPPGVEPSSAPSQSSSTPSPSETAASPAPAALGPEDTVRAWVDARNVALQDGDTTGTEALTHGRCATCEDLLEPIRSVYAAGGHFETTGWTVTAARLQDSSPTKAEVAVGLEYAAGRTFPDGESKPIEYQPERHVAVFRLVEERGRWLVSFIGFLS